MTKTSHEAREETITACEGVALLSEPDLGGDSIYGKPNWTKVYREV
jgi:hypothetical protein